MELDRRTVLKAAGGLGAGGAGVVGAAKQFSGPDYPQIPEKLLGTVEGYGPLRIYLQSEYGDKRNSVTVTRETSFRIVFNSNEIPDYFAMQISRPSSIPNLPAQAEIASPSKQYAYRNWDNPSLSPILDVRFRD